MNSSYRWYVLAYKAIPTPGIKTSEELAKPVSFPQLPF
jgi:hypothetical protein